MRSKMRRRCEGLTYRVKQNKTKIYKIIDGGGHF